jgi:hypothetical protein
MFVSDIPSYPYHRLSFAKILNNVVIMGIIEITLLYYWVCNIVYTIANKQHMAVAKLPMLHVRSIMLPLIVFRMLS